MLFAKRNAKLAGAHAQACPAAARRIDLEQGKPVYRLDRRGPLPARHRGGAARGRTAEAGGVRLRSGAYLGAETGHQDAVARARRHGPDVDTGARLLAAERAPLRRAAGPEQGGNGGEIRRGTGTYLAAQLRRAPSRADP